MHPPRPDLPRPADGDRDRGRLGGVPAGVWVKAIAGFGLALVVVTLLPRGSGQGQPPVRTLLLVGIPVIAFTTGALYLGIRRDLKLPIRVAVYFVASNVLIVVVKFMLAPRALYETNQLKPFDALLGEGPLLVGAGAFVLVLYVGVFWLLYRIARMTMDVRDDIRPRAGLAKGGIFAFGASLTALVVLGIGGLTLVSGAGSQYLDFVFSSALSLAIAVVLTLAGALVLLGFRSVSEGRRAVVDASVLLNLLWVGLAFLGLYHVLWVVYLLVLTSIWPLKVVVPK
jgi:hypothetical protein